ncbi:MAG: hypothetical protein II386_08755, partial [Bacteroidaceae bacterium]|nr:hypothetical protein [Bacteroidaceae bacterium]
FPSRMRDGKDEWNKGVTHDNKGLHDVRRSGFSFQRHVNTISRGKKLKSKPSETEQIRWL